MDLAFLQLRRARTMVPRAEVRQADMGALSFSPTTFEAMTALEGSFHLLLAGRRPLFRHVDDWLRWGAMYWRHGDADSHRCRWAERGLVWRRKAACPRETVGLPSI